MNIGKVIFLHRKEKSMTQEQLAEKLGVSVPAVSKWETNVSMPDITLLGPIARIFNITIDNLLSFQKELTEDEINQIMTTIREKSETSGLMEGMKYADEMLHQYPNSEKLRFETAYKLTSLSGLSEIYAKEREAILICREKATKLFEELINSDDFYISNASKTGLASIYMGNGRLDDAEIIFNQMKIPEEWNSKRILPSIYLMKEEYEKAFIASEENLETDWSNMVIDLRSIYNIAIKKQDYDRAFKIAKAVCLLGDTFGTWLNNGLDMLLDVYLLKNDEENALPAFETYMDKLIESDNNPNARLGIPIFFSEFNEQKKNQAITTGITPFSVNLMQIMYHAISNDKKYDGIRHTETYQRCMNKLSQRIKVN